VAEIAIGKLKRYKSPGVDRILVELIQAGGETLLSEVHKLIKLIWRKEELITLPVKIDSCIPIHKKGGKTAWINFRGRSFLLTSYKILSNFSALR
jgi:hypothetical protein